MAENWLDAIIPGIQHVQVDGVAVATAEARRTVNLTGGVSAVDNVAEERIDISWGGAASLATAALQGEVNAFGATANTILCSDGATAGGVWRAFLSIGTNPPAAGDVRLSPGTTFRGLDAALVGEAQVLDWGSTSADHVTIGANDADLDGVDIVAGAAGEFDVRVGAATNLQVNATTVSTPGNAVWSLGTNYVTHGSAPAASGALRLSTGDLVNWADGTSAIHTFLVEAYGAVADAETVSNGTTVATDATLTSASNPWVAADVGKVIRVRGAGAAGADHYTTIASFTSAGSIEMTDVAVTSVAGTAVVDWGTDNTTAIQAALTACKTAGGGVVQLSTGVYGVTGHVALASAEGVTLQGMGRAASTIADLRPDVEAAADLHPNDGLVSFNVCSGVWVKHLGMRGAVQAANLGENNTTTNTRKGIVHRDCADSGAVDCYMTLLRDEAIYAGDDCPRWTVAFCSLYQCNGNAINLNTNWTESEGALIVGNSVAESAQSSVLISCKSSTTVGNTFGMRYGYVVGAGLIGIDMFGCHVFSGNAINGFQCDAAAVSIIDVIGTPRDDANILIANNTIRACKVTAHNTHDFGDGEEPLGAVIECHNAFGDFSGTLRITGNTITDCDQNLDEAEARMVLVNGLAATGRVTISDNVLRNNGNGFFHKAIVVANNAAGSVVDLRNNVIDGFSTHYDVDSAARWQDQVRVSATKIDHTVSPYAVLETDSMILADSSGAAVHIDLPPVADSAGRQIMVVDWAGAASAFAITLDADGAETINGVATVDITTDGDAANCYCDGLEWRTIPL